MDIQYRLLIHKNFSAFYNIIDKKLYYIARPDLQKEFVYYDETHCHMMKWDDMSIIEPYVEYFTHMENVIYNKRNCMIYYNNSNELYIIADASNNLLLYKNDTVITFSDYDFSPIPPTAFTVPLDQPYCKNQSAYQAPEKDYYTIECPVPAGLPSHTNVPFSFSTRSNEPFISSWSCTVLRACLFFLLVTLLLLL